MVARLETVAEAVMWLRAKAPGLQMSAEVDSFDHFPVTGEAIEDSEDPDSKWVVGSNGIGRPDGRFYTVQNVRTEVPRGREVTFWFSPMIVGDGEGYLLLVTDETDAWILLRAKAEPGNTGVTLEDGSSTRVLFSTPLQASKSNIEAHGSRVPFVGLVDQVPKWHAQPEDGGRFFGKVNGYAHLQIDPELVETEIASGPNPNDFVWVSREAVRQLLRQGLLNSHLRAALAALV